MAHFKPPADVKMIAEMQAHSSRNAKRKRDKAKAESEPTVQMLIDQLTCLPRKIAATQIFASLVTHLAKTKEGHSWMAQTISQKEIVNLLAGGNSKAALNKSKKMAAGLIIGLATILDPDNPDQLRSLMSATQEKPSSSLSAAPMHPRNPHLSNLQAVLPQCHRDP
jgi:hypothetical protein